MTRDFRKENNSSKESWLKNFKISLTEYKRKHPELYPEEELVSNTSQNTFCQCKNSHCAKNYCKCRASFSHCSEHCLCIECLNCEEGEEFASSYIGKLNPESNKALLRDLLKELDK